MNNSSVSHLRREVLVGGISNTLFNGVIAWLLLRGGSGLAWGGEHSFVVDILATAFLLPFIVALIVIPLQKNGLARGRLEPVDLTGNPRLGRLVGRLPESTFARALAFGLIGLAVIAPLTLLFFRLLGVEVVEPANYAIFKGLWAGLMAAVMVIPMVLCALTTAPAAVQA
jgi:hypothetical protein